MPCDAFETSTAAPNADANGWMSGAHNAMMIVRGARPATNAEDDEDMLMAPSNNNSTTNADGVTLQEFETMAKRGRIHMAAEDMVKPSKADLNKARSPLDFGLRQTFVRHSQWRLNLGRAPSKSRSTQQNSAFFSTAASRFAIA